MLALYYTEVVFCRDMIAALRELLPVLGTRGFTDEVFSTTSPLNKSTLDARLLSPYVSTHLIQVQKYLTILPNKSTGFMSISSFYKPNHWKLYAREHSYARQNKLVSFGS